MGVAGGRRWGGGGRDSSCLREGCPGSGTLPPPTAHPLGVLPGPAAVFSWRRELRVRGPVTDPTVRALASWRCALWGWQDGAPGGGGLVPPGEVSGVGHSPIPDRPSSGRAAGAHCPFSLGAGGAGVRGYHQTRSAGSCHLALRAVGWQEGARGGGGASGSVSGVRVWALSLPRPPVLWACIRGPLPCVPGCGGCGCAGASPTPQRDLARWRCALWGWQEGTWEGARCASVSGVLSRAVSLPRPPVPWACSRGPLPFFPGRGGCGYGGPSPTPHRALLRASVARLGGCRRAPRGGGGGVVP